jgi:hypothetical protein
MTKSVLFEELRQGNPALADNLQDVYKRAIEIWGEQSLRAFTVHGKPHIDQVAKNLDQLTRPLLAVNSPLGPEEIYVLLAACYLHDIGMQLDLPDARERHAEHSFDLILNSFDTRFRELFVQLPIADTNAREAIALVARGHWTSFALQLVPQDFIYGNQRGRLRLLGALLATADLLDLSPVRARYFRSPHRLFSLDPNSGLHQTTHQLVRGFEIRPLRPDVPGDLRFTVNWRDDSEEVRRIADWVLHWFTSQWRQLQPILHADSGGAIRWAKPWAGAVFRQPLGPQVTLSYEARGNLEAERTEQLRIDRDEFCHAFLGSLEEGRRVLFRLPQAAGGDGSPISEWCAAQPRRHEGVLVARLDVLQSDAPDLVSLVADILEQWGEHLNAYSEGAALGRLENILAAEGGKASVIIVATDAYPRPLGLLIQALFERSKKALIVVLFSPAVVGPEALAGVDLQRPSWSEVRIADLEDHLRQSWRYDKGVAERLARDASNLGLCQSPGLLYRYVEQQGRAWDNVSEQSL